MFFTQGRQRFVTGLCGEHPCGFKLKKNAQLKRIADKIKIDMGDLHPALGHGGDQTIGLKPGDQFANGAKRHAGNLDQLTLGDKLARSNIAGQQMFSEAVIGFAASALS